MIPARWQCSPLVAPLGNRRRHQLSAIALQGVFLPPVQIEQGNPPHLMSSDGSCFVCRVCSHCWPEGHNLLAAIGCCNWDQSEHSLGAALKTYPKNLNVQYHVKTLLGPHLPYSREA